MKILHNFKFKWKGQTCKKRNRFVNRIWKPSSTIVWLPIDK